MKFQDIIGTSPDTPAFGTATYAETAWLAVYKNEQRNEASPSQFELYEKVWVMDTDKHLYAGVVIGLNFNYNQARYKYDVRLGCPFPSQLPNQGLCTIVDEVQLRKIEDFPLEVYGIAPYDSPRAVLYYRIVRENAQHEPVDADEWQYALPL